LFIIILAYFLITFLETVLFSVALEASHPSGPIGWFDVAGLSLGPISEKKAGTHTNRDPKTLNSLGLVKKLGFVFG